MKGNEKISICPWCQGFHKMTECPGFIEANRFLYMMMDHQIKKIKKSMAEADK